MTLVEADSMKVGTFMNEELGTHNGRPENRCERMRRYD